MWRLDALETPYMNEFASCWGLLAGSLLIALPLILYKIKDHVSVAEDMAFSDQTYAEVAPSHDAKVADGHDGLTLLTMRGEEKV